jgi:membrane-bound lytic murein transglycosylase D
LDEELLVKVCRGLQEEFQGEYVIDLAALREGAAALVPVLEEQAETKPYAAWLKSRLDYLEVADELRLSIPPPTPGQPVPNPKAELQRQVWRRHLTKQPVAKAAANYVARLKPVFVAQRVPAELVWLAEVESAFDPRARSPAGAAGLFQLMPVTATTRGLRLRPEDERLNPEKSAAAAAKYLRELHGKFKDWRLALAAYNAGETRVRSLLRRYKGKTFDDIARHLPAETQMYVPKLEATVRRREGVELTELNSR